MAINLTTTMTLESITTSITFITRSAILVQPQTQ